MFIFKIHLFETTGLQPTWLRFIHNSYFWLGSKRIMVSNFRWHNTDSRESRFVNTDPTVVRASRKTKKPNVLEHNPGAICRGWHQNQLVPGTTTTPDQYDNKTIKCAVKQFAGSDMHFLDSFQV